jgi:hypothetical protein
LNWSNFALAGLLIPTIILLVVPRMTGTDTDQWPALLVWTLLSVIVASMFVLGREDRRKEKEADTWVNDPRKSAFENWLEKRRQRFSPARGLSFFFLGLVAFSIVVGFSAMFGEVASMGRAVVFVIGMSLVAGLIGMFTENVPL